MRIELESEMQTGIITERCPLCASMRQLEDGFCLGCLLKVGLDDEPEAGALDFSDIPDGYWRLGGYELLEEIGRGGMGIIYRARQPHSNRLVALKRILPQHGDSTETATRLRREAETAAKLDHPHILPIYEVGNGADGLPFFSMKLAGGGNLAQARERLVGDPQAVVGLMLKVARAVQYAHSQKILHRDLKPANILLDGRGEPLVADFGLAKWLERPTDLTRTLTTFGTPGYVAPEQALGSARDVGPAADIYSLGAMLYELFSGRPPFTGDNAWAVVRQASEVAAPALRKLVPAADRDLETICARCLEGDPQARYRTAGDLADDLQCWLDGRPIHARPVSLPERGWRWVKRNPGMAMLFTALVVMSGVAISLNYKSYLPPDPKKVLAFLPCETLEGDEPSRKMAAALSRELEHQLDTQKEIYLLHTKKTQAATTHDLATRTGAKTVLAGTVRQVGDRWRVVMRLTGESEKEPLWVRIIEIPAGSGQEKVDKRVSQIVEALQTRSRLPGGLPTMELSTQNIEANDFYRKAKEFYFRGNEPDTRHAIALLEKCLQLDPGHAGARAMRAQSYIGIYEQWDTDKRLLDMARDDAEKAVMLAPNRAEGYRALGDVHQDMGDNELSLEAYRNALELNPENPTYSVLVGVGLREIGSVESAIAYMRKAAALETIRGVYQCVLGETLLLCARDDEAEKALRRAIEMDPDNPGAFFDLALMHLWRGDFTKARQAWGEANKQFPNYRHGGLLEAQIEFFAGNYPEAERLYQEMANRPDEQPKLIYFGGIRIESALALLRQISGDNTGMRTMLDVAETRDGKELVDSPGNPRLLHDMAANAAIDGKSKESLNLLRQAIEKGWREHRSTNLDPRFASVRNQPEFQELLRNANPARNERNAPISERKIQNKQQK